MVKRAQDFLQTITQPADIKGLSYNELLQLAADMRKRIIDVMSVNGGHLASSLGAVEMILALHRTFDAPKDKLIFDVGHQTYPHKLLTGRNDRFDQVRKYQGLCGFTHPQESPYDHFHAGHAGTALSLGLGLAANRDLSGGDEYILPVIGDATLTCGLTLEALNNIRRDLQRFVVVLNDNAMSISVNVGAVTGILNRLLNGPVSNKLTQELEQLVAKIPACGNALAKKGHKLAEAIRNLVRPAPFFDEYGLTYIGPIDGHDLRQLLDVLEAIKQLNGPVILHVLTKKGQGMPQAMNNPVTYHGAKPFCPETGKFLPTPSTRPTFPKVFGKTLLELAERDDKLVAVTPAMSAGSCLDAFMQKFPKRCIDVGIAEGHCVTFCGGLAYGGARKVVCSIYATFLQRALDNLFHDVCLQELPVLFAIDRAGISGPDGSTHHGVYDIAFLNSMPGMIIAQPRNGQVLAELLHEAMAWTRPGAIRYPNMETDSASLPLAPRPLGQAEKVADGTDVAILGLGHMCQTALQVRDLLQEAGISAAVIDPIYLKPFDEALLAQLARTYPHLATIEEHSLPGGLGSIVNNFLATQGFDRTRVHNFGIPDRFVSHGGYKELIDELGLSPSKIAEKLARALTSPPRLSLINA